MTCAHATGGVGLVPGTRASRECALHGPAPGQTGQVIRSGGALPCPAVRCPTSFSERMRTPAGPLLPPGSVRKPLFVL